MPAASFLTIDDGTLAVQVPSCSMFAGGFARTDPATGHGITEYANGGAKRWVRFKAKTLTITGRGPVPHGIWALDLGVNYWLVTYPSWNNDGTTIQEQYVPAQPADTRDINTGRTSWSLILRAAVAG